MASLLYPGAVLTGRRLTYKIVKELYRATDNGAVYFANGADCNKYIVKSIIGHSRLQNEAQILTRYQADCPSLRPLVEDLSDKSPPSIVLRYLDNDLLAESNKNRLSRPEIKQVARAVLTALDALHKDGLVHTDIKLDNILVNHGTDGARFSDIQLGDCGGVVHETSTHAREGDLIGADLFRSPEAALQLPWDRATDIWSFGNAIISLVFGGGFHLFNPRLDGVTRDDFQTYYLTVLKRMYQFFGPFPTSYERFESEYANAVMSHVNTIGLEPKPFSRITPREVPFADRAFILKIMKLDPADRPTPSELLNDEWFEEDSLDTRTPLL